MFTKEDFESLPCFKKWILSSADSTCKNVQIDSRRIVAGDLFVPIMGENYDGHDFLVNVVQKVKICCTQKDLSEDILKIARENDCGIFQVSDTLLCLQELAKLYKNRFLNLKVIAITGSNGKTSTKEILAACLNDGTENCLKTEGNTNNHIGVPLNIFRLKPHHKFAVLELGTNHFGEIEILAKIAKPDVAIITCIGGAHLEFFKNRDGVALEKTSIYRFMKKDGIAIVPKVEMHRESFQESLNNKKIITFGDSQELADFCGKTVEENLYSEKVEIKFKDKFFEWNWHLKGTHQAVNASAVFAACAALNLDLEKLPAKLESLNLAGMRSAISKNNGILWINDAYNANKDSTLASLKWLRANAKDVKGRIFVALGDILELGENSFSEHKEIIDFMNENSFWFKFITVGINYLAADIGKISSNFPTSLLAKDFILTQLKPNDAVLLKGSRGLKMELIIA